MARYKQHSAVDGEWTDWDQPVMRGYRLACCDCGLVHELDFRVVRVTKWLGNRTTQSVQVRGHRVQFRVKRLNRATGQMRRHMKRKMAE